MRFQTNTDTCGPGLSITFAAETELWLTFLVIRSIYNSE